MASGWFPFARVACAITLLTLAWGCRSPDSSDRLQVYVAASMSDAVDSISIAFANRFPGVDVVHNVASTSLLGRQIEQGASPDLYFSADTSWISYLTGKGRIESSKVLPVSNALVLIKAKTVTNESAGHTTGESNLRVSNGVTEELFSFDRIALGDPSHVPAGQYAKEALECLGVWTRLQDRIVPAADVRAAAVGVVLGSTDAAIVYQSDLSALSVYAITPVVIPPDCQPRISLGGSVVVGTDDNSLAQRYLDFAVGTDAASIWSSYGFVVE